MARAIGNVWRLSAVTGGDVRPNAVWLSWTLGRAPVVRLYMRLAV